MQLLIAYLDKDSCAIVADYLTTSEYWRQKFRNVQLQDCLEIESIASNLSRDYMSKMSVYKMSDICCRYYGDRWFLDQALGDCTQIHGMIYPRGEHCSGKHEINKACNAVRQLSPMDERQQCSRMEYAWNQYTNALRKAHETGHQWDQRRACLWHSRQRVQYERLRLIIPQDIDIVCR